MNTDPRPTVDLAATDVLTAERRTCGECRESALGICPWHSGYEAGIRAKAIEVCVSTRPANGEEGLRAAAAEVIRLGNQPGMDDAEWEAAMTALEEAWRRDVPGPPDPPRRNYPEPMG